MVALAPEEQLVNFGSVSSDTHIRKLVTNNFAVDNSDNICIFLLIYIPNHFTQFPNFIDFSSFPTGSAQRRPVDHCTVSWLHILTLNGTIIYRLC